MVPAAPTPISTWQFKEPPHPEMLRVLNYVQAKAVLPGSTGQLDYNRGTGVTSIYLRLGQADYDIEPGLVGMEEVWIYVKERS